MTLNIRRVMRHFWDTILAWYRAHRTIVWTALVCVAMLPPFLVLWEVHIEDRVRAHLPAGYGGRPPDVQQPILRPLRRVLPGLGRGQVDRAQPTPQPRRRGLFRRWR